MKITAAFKLSALVVALSSTSMAFATTSNTGSVDKNIWTIDKDKLVLNTDGKDGAGYQFTDFGSGKSDKIITDGSNDSRPVNVQHHVINSKDYYLVNEKPYVEDPDNKGKLIRADIELGAFTKDTFKRGGTSDNFVENGYTQSDEIKRIDSNNVTYGSTDIATTGAVKADVAVTTSQTVTQAFEIDIAGSSQTLGSDKVVLGVVTNDHKDKYGVSAVKEKDGKVLSSSVLTASGITTSGYIKANTIEIDGQDLGESLKEINTDIETNANGIKNNKDAIAKVDKKIEQLNDRATDLNTRINDVEKTANRGVAISLAAQQQVPNIGAGQTAFYGGVGHYESESAFALGLTTVFGNGRTSLSGAVGVAGGSEVGGRVGIAHVFGGK